MRLNRNKLRRLLLRESKQILKEMSMQGPQPGTPEYDYTAQIIQQVLMSCMQQGRCDEMQVSMMCQDMCQSYGCPQFASYCTQRVITTCRQIGLL